MMARLTIHAQQEAIIASFACLMQDRASMLDYLLDIGHALPAMDPIYQTEAYLVPGCLSKVWLVDESIDGCLFFKADSNTVITKGLIALLLRVLDGQPIADIAQAQLYFPAKIGMDGLIGFQRSSGFAHMVQAIKLRALRALSLEGRA